MRPRSRIVSSLLFAGGLASATLVGACYHHHYRETETTTYSVQWTPAEEPRYEQWENETHRSHQDWGKRKSDEQHDYWEWRKQHS